MSGFDLRDYVDVAQRVQDFYAKFPEGSIQTEIVELTEKRVTVKACAYRNPMDRLPAIGHSWLGIPGMTSYTKGSELENAETSAVGRAIAMAGFATKGGIASRQEIESKQGEADRPAIPTGPSTLSGTVAKGTGNGMDLLMRQGPNGPAFGFKLTEIEGHPRGKKSTGVRAFGPAAEELQRHADVLVGSKLIVSGTWRGESFKDKDGRDVAYDVLVLETAEGAGITIPPDAVTPEPPGAMSDDDLSTLPW